MHLLTRMGSSVNMLAQPQQDRCRRRLQPIFNWPNHMHSGGRVHAAGLSRTHGANLETLGPLQGYGIPLMSNTALSHEQSPFFVTATTRARYFPSRDSLIPFALILSAASF